MHEHLPSDILRPGKGILALDESEKTAGKRLESVGLPNNPESRLAFRSLFIEAPGIEEYLSGVILPEEGVAQRSAEALAARGILTGVKLDYSLEPMPNSPLEFHTKGLDSLKDRIGMYQGRAAFTKWRFAIPVSDELPTPEALASIAEDAGVYALIVQEAGMVPIVEPEVLYSGTHTLERSAEVLETTLRNVIQGLVSAGAALETTIIKTSMALAGKESGFANEPEEVAEKTLAAFAELPPELAGVVFLSGGQDTEMALKNLAALVQQSKLPFPVTFSFARAIQEPVLRAWGGDPARVESARQVLLEVLRRHQSAAQGVNT